MLHEGLQDPVELAVAVLLSALPSRRSPGGLFGWVEAPNDDVASATRVIVPGGVPGTPALAVGTAAEHTTEGGLHLGEEDKIVGPFMGSRLLVGLGTCLPRF
jgi:hypothetical protein